MTEDTNEPVQASPDEMQQLVKEILIEQSVAEDLATVSSRMISRMIDMVKLASSISSPSTGGSQKAFSLWAAFCCGDVFIDHMLSSMVRDQTIAPAMAAALQQGCIYARNCYKGHVATATAPGIAEDSLKMISQVIPEWFGGEAK